MSIMETMLSKALKEGTPEKIAEVVSEIAVRVKGDLAVSMAVLLLIKVVKKVRGLENMPKDYLISAIQQEVEKVIGEDK